MQGEKQKIGVGRKITYQFAIEEQLVEYGLVEREKDSGLTFKQLKVQAKALLENSPSSKRPFKASHSWAKKFCRRNKLEVGNLWWAVPKAFPQ